ncbi:MAG: AAA family ATPase [Candidatus Limnocylindrales bacterium]|nr:AAA family ATPase [Candidatus Limnocylindrales bacterium]
MPVIAIPPGIEGIVGITELPDPAWADRWDRIVVAEDLKERLLNYMVFSLRHRGRLRAVALPVHGLVILSGPPGTGKTTLAGGLADRAAQQLGQPVLFVDINPHAFPSQLLGESQRSVARLFERTLPDLAARGILTVVLLDEVEAMAVNRSGASLETNPVDVHRATEAVLAGVDHVARTCPGVTFIATTNHRAGVDVAFISRADLVEEIDYPDAAAVHAILVDTLRELTDRPLDEVGLRALADRCAASQVDARQVRKLVLRAICDRRDLAVDPSGISVLDLEQTFRAGRGRLEAAT